MDDGREDKLPWVKWFWADYLSDTGLASSSLAAQGLWMRMLSIMAKSKIVGFMLDGESKMESKTLAKLVGEEVGVVDSLLAELKLHNVYSQGDGGVIFNRRMARTGYISEVRAEAGRKGGRPKSKTKVKKEKKQKLPSASAYASASASASASKEKSKENFDPLFEEFWEGYPKKIHKDYAREKFMILARAGKIPDLKKATKGYMDYLKDQHVKRNFKQEPLNPATFLMKNRWRDYIEFKYEPPM